MAIDDILPTKSRQKMLDTRRLFNANMDTTATTTSGIGSSASLDTSNINDNQNAIETLLKNSTNFELIMPSTSSVSGARSGHIALDTNVNNNNDGTHNNNTIFSGNLNISHNYNIDNMNFTYEETIHSGHFMLSQVHDDKTADDYDDENIVKEEKDAQSSSTGLNFLSSSTSHENVGATNLDFREYSATQSTLFSIDGSLTKLFECMTLAYSGKIVSPKWKPFKGMRLRGKEIVRLNNIIWREWFMQYIQNKKPVVCQFANPLPDDSHKRTEAVVMEGKYWKRRLESVTGEYKSWRKFSKNQITRARRNSTTSKGSSQNSLYEWAFQGLNATESNDAYKIEDMEFSDALFSLSQPFPFPNPRELMQTGYVDLIQPVLMQLQPNLEDYMDTIEPMQLFSDIFKSQNLPTSTVTSYQSEPNLLSMDSDLTSELTAQGPPLNQQGGVPSSDPLKEKNCSLGISSLKSTHTMSPAPQTNLYSVAPVQLQPQPQPQQQQPLSTLNLLQSSAFCSPHTVSHVGGDGQAPLLTDSSISLQPSEPQVPEQMFDKMLQQYTNVLPKVDAPQVVNPIVHQSLNQFLGTGTTVVAPSYKGTAAVNKDPAEVNTILSALINDAVNSSQPNLAPNPSAACTPPPLSIPLHQKDSMGASSIVDTPAVLDMHPAAAGNVSRVCQPGEQICPRKIGVNNFALVSSGATSSNNPDSLSIGLPRLDIALRHSPSSTDISAQVSPIVSSSAATDLHHKSSAIGRRHSYNSSSPLLSTTNNSSSSSSNNSSSITGSGNYHNNKNNKSSSSGSSSSSASFNRSQGFAVPSSPQVAKSKHRPTTQSTSTAVATVSEMPSPSYTTNHTFLAQLLTTGTYPSPSIDVKQEPHAKTCANTTATSTSITSSTTNYAPIRPAREPISSAVHTPISVASAIPTSIPNNLTNVPSGNKATSSVPSFSNSVLVPARNQPFHQDTSALTTTKQGNQGLQSEISSKADSPILCLGSPLSQGQDMDVSSFSTQTNVSSLKPKQNRVHPNEHRRVSHISAEQKRRCNIKSGFDVLHSLIPSLKQTPTGKVSKATLLQKAAEFCKKMKSERVKMQNESEVLKLEIDSLNSDISYCQSQLPATGAPVTRADQINEMYDEYVRLRTNQNWKFWIFSIITRPLFNTYNNIVSTASMDEMCRTVMSWFDQYCSLAALRPSEYLLTFLIVFLSACRTISLSSFSCLYNIFGIIFSTFLIYVQVCVCVIEGAWLSR
eukprot:XP_014786236.1 PREDICTED: carbohydrate-responsive element-binding protein-like isoform X3 [Octopus bimaculoides]